MSAQCLKNKVVTTLEPTLILGITSLNVKEMSSFLKPLTVPELYWCAGCWTGWHPYTCHSRLWHVLNMAMELSQPGSSPALNAR